MVSHKTLKIAIPVILLVVVVTLLVITLCNQKRHNDVPVIENWRVNPSGKDPYSRATIDYTRNDQTTYDYSCTQPNSSRTGRRCNDYIGGPWYNDLTSAPGSVTYAETQISCGSHSTCKKQIPSKFNPLCLCPSYSNNPLSDRGGTCSGTGKKCIVRRDVAEAIKLGSTPVRNKWEPNPNAWAEGIKKVTYPEQLVKGCKGGSDCPPNSECYKGWCREICVDAIDSSGNIVKGSDIPRAKSVGFKYRGDSGDTSRHGMGIHNAWCDYGTLEPIYRR